MYFQFTGVSKVRNHSKKSKTNTQQSMKNLRKGKKHLKQVRPAHKNTVKLKHAKQQKQT